MVQCCCGKIVVVASGAREAAPTILGGDETGYWRGSAIPDAAAVAAKVAEWCSTIRRGEMSTASNGNAVVYPQHDCIARLEANVPKEQLCQHIAYNWVAVVAKGVLAKVEHDVVVARGSRSPRTLDMDANEDSG